MLIATIHENDIIKSDLMKKGEIQCFIGYQKGNLHKDYIMIRQKCQDANALIRITRSHVAYGTAEGICFCSSLKV